MMLQQSICAAALSFEKGMGANHACILHDFATKLSYLFFSFVLPFVWLSRLASLYNINFLEL
jgi:hypothetical protein